MKTVAWLVAAALMLPATGALAAKYDPSKVVSETVTVKGNKQIKKIVVRVNEQKTKVIKIVTKVPKTTTPPPTTPPVTAPGPISVPEPASAALLGASLLALGLIRRKKV